VCVGLITNSWTIAQIHGGVAKSRHLSKIAAGCQNRGNRGFRDVENFFWPYLLCIHEHESRSSLLPSCRWNTVQVQVMQLYWFLEFDTISIRYC